MPEPTAPTVAAGGATAALIWLFGPSAPAYAWLVLCAFVGALHPWSRQRFDNAARSALYLLMNAGGAAIMTGVVVWALERYAGVPANQWPGAVAFLIAFLGDKWAAWWAVVGDALADRGAALVRSGPGTQPPDPAAGRSAPRTPPATPATRSHPPEGQP